MRPPWHKRSALSPLMCAMLPLTIQRSRAPPRRGGVVPLRRVELEARGLHHAASPRAMPRDTLHAAAWPQIVSR